MGYFLLIMLFFSSISYAQDVVKIDDQSYRKSIVVNKADTMALIDYYTKEIEHRNQRIIVINNQIAELQSKIQELNNDLDDAR